MERLPRSAEKGGLKKKEERNSQTRQKLVPNIGHMIILGVGAVLDTSFLTLTTCKYQHLYFEFLLAPF